MTFCVSSQEVNSSNDPEFPATGAFFESNVRAGLRGPVRSGAMQTHKPTALTKKTCKREPLEKRLKGFEPSTFSMASSWWVAASVQMSLQRAGFCAWRG